MRVGWTSTDSENGTGRLEYLIKTAGHESVTEQVLTGTLNSRWLRPEIGWLHEKPLIAYLRSDEHPQFIFESTATVSSGVRGDCTPSDPYKVIYCITDERILIVVGQEPSNSLFSVEFDDILKYAVIPSESDPAPPSSVDRRRTKFNPTFQTQTTDEQLTVPLSDSVTIGDLKTTSKYICAQTSLSGWAYSEYWRSVEDSIERKQRAWEQEQERKLKERKRRQRKAELARKRVEQKRRSRLETIVLNSKSSSVTVESVDPVLDSLCKNEGVLYLLNAGERKIILRDAHRKAGEVPHETQRWTAVTTQRVILANEHTEEILHYDAIEDVGIFRHGPTSEDDQTYLKISTADLHLLLDASNYTYLHLQELVSEIRRRMDMKR